MKSIKQPNIRDLGIIGDQKTCALVDKKGTIAWYCPDRFDSKAIFSLLLDADKGGYWALDTQATFKGRTYKGNSAILCSEFSSGEDSFLLTDWMPFCDEELEGICRLTSAFVQPIVHRICPRGNYGLHDTHIELEEDGSAVISSGEQVQRLFASHPVQAGDGFVEIRIPAGEQGWVCLFGHETPGPDLSSLKASLTDTLKKWEKRLQSNTYTGVYEEQIASSCLAVCLMTHIPTGGIIAAATTSLPEGYGNHRNYDYRYVWLRDAAMIVSAHIRAIGMDEDADKFLNFLSTTRHKHQHERFMPFYDLNQNIVTSLKELPLGGYKGDQPVVTGNDANEQLQLDANGNVLLAAKLIYARQKDKPYWETVRTIADFVVDNWHRKDHGIWEESVEEHYTSSKVIAAKGLEFIAEYADDEVQANRWRQAARDIREFVARECLTSSGAYAVYPGSEKVDVTAALFPVWLYDEPDSPEMEKTMQEIENTLRYGELYHRHLEQFDSRQEGVFLAGSLWVAQYYIMLKDFAKARTIIDSALTFSNDLGFLAEEGNVATGEMLGNFPQTFVHASLMGAIVDLNVAEGKKGGVELPTSYT